MRECVGGSRPREDDAREIPIVEPHRVGGYSIGPIRLIRPIAPIRPSPSRAMGARGLIGAIGAIGLIS